MNSKSISVLLAIAACTITAARANAQARVTENEPVTLYVSSAHGSDANPGTSAKPFATIQAGVNGAAAQNRKGLGVKVLVEAGTYRETVNIGHFSNAASFTLEAANAGTAAIDGADVLTKWSSVGHGVYAFPWTDSVTGCSLPHAWYSDMPSVALANDMFFVNGATMSQVMSAGQLRPGTFYVNEAYKQVEVAPPAGTDMDTAVFEVAARRSTLTVHDAKNLVVRGLVLEHGASCMNTTAATVNSSRNVLFDSDVVLWNNWSGLGFNSSTDITVENTIGSNNGGVGLAGWRIINGLWQNNETDYNNWRGAMVGLYDFGQGGIKLMLIHGGSVVGHASYNNQAQGLWFDTDNENITVSGATLVGNLVGNMQIELNKGPIAVNNSSFCSGGGVQILETDDLTLTGNHFYGNGGTTFQNAQLFLGGKTYGRSMRNWQTGVTSNVISNNVTLSGNTFTGTDATQYLFNTYLGGSDWNEFADSLKSNNNVWYNDQKQVAYGIPDGKHINLSGWRSLLSQDENSSWALADAANTGCSVPTPAYPDFQMQAHNAASYTAAYKMANGTVAIPLQLKSFNFGSVSLSVSGLPKGVSASFTVPTLTSGHSVLKLTATSAAATEQVPVTIFGTSGGRVHSITVWVAVARA
jgi:hypothetical protein